MASSSSGAIFIVESGAKCKTIQKFLPDGIKVMASLGHVCDLNTKKKGYDPGDFRKIEYAPLSDKKAVIKKLLEATRDASMVYLAMDPDREGCAIAEHLRRILKLKPGRFCRVTFNEITQEAILGGIERAVGEIDANLFAAQEARKLMDCIIGFKVSPLLWKYFAENRLSAGRVQSAALGLVVERCRERDSSGGGASGGGASGGTIWRLRGTFEGDLIGMASGEPLQTEAAVLEALAHLRELKVGGTVWDVGVVDKIVTKNPAAPYTTSSLQQDAWTVLRMPGKAAMAAAQQLYEGGHITYMRTDSVTLSKEAQTNICGFVSKTYGTDYVHCRQYKTKAANAQEAHEAIRPTKVDVMDVGGEVGALYKLIWKRAVASQMRQAQSREWTFTVGVGVGACTRVPTFSGQKTVLVDPGFLILNGKKGCAAGGDVIAFPQKVLCKDIMAIGDVTRAIPAFNDATIIKAMEVAGIGRPSTYAPTIDKLFNKGYVCKTNTSEKVKVVDYGLEGKPRGDREICLSESGRMESTAIGEGIYDYIKGAVPFILDCAFTSDMEGKLDQIAKGGLDGKEVLRDFYGTLKPYIDTASGPGAGGGFGVGVGDGGHKRRYIIEKTRYGLAVKVGEKYIGLDAYLKWCNKPIQAMEDREIDMLISLPRDGLCYGRYGLYTKEKAGRDVIEGIIQGLLSGLGSGEAEAEEASETEAV